MPDSSEAPTFSVIVGCYNHAAFARETVTSVLSQTCKPHQVIVVDDASTDSSVSVLREFGDQITLLACKENRGGSAARNSGAAVATGDYLVFLDGDDALAPWALELYSHVATSKKPKIILSKMFFFGGPTVMESDIYLYGNTPLHNFDVYEEEIKVVDYGPLAKKDRPFRPSGTSMVIERVAFNKVGGWTEDIFPGEDFDLLLKLLYEHPAIHILHPPSAYCRSHANNTTRQVRRFCNGLITVINRAKDGYYNKLNTKRSDSFNMLAGGFLYWARKVLGTRDFLFAAKFIANGLPIVPAAVTRKLKDKIAGPLPVESLGRMTGAIPN